MAELFHSRVENRFLQVIKKSSSTHHCTQQIIVALSFTNKYTPNANTNETNYALLRVEQIIYET